MVVGVTSRCCVNFATERLSCFLNRGTDFPVDRFSGVLVAADLTDAFLRLVTLPGAIFFGATSISTPKILAS